MPDLKSQGSKQLYNIAAYIRNIAAETWAAFGHLFYNRLANWIVVIYFYDVDLSDSWLESNCKPLAQKTSVDFINLRCLISMATLTTVKKTPLMKDVHSGD